MSPAAHISVPGRRSTVESLNATLSRDGGAGKEIRLKAIRPSSGGEITGFVVE